MQRILHPEEEKATIRSSGLPVSVLQRPAGGAGENLPALWEGDNVKKRCTKCGEFKPVEAFARDMSKRDGLHPACRQCRGAYARARYAANPEKFTSWRSDRKAANIDYLASIMPLRCEVCGYDKCFAALDFHHTDPSQKENSWDSMGHWIKLSLESFKDKIQANNFKVLCKNCHTELHANGPEERMAIPLEQANCVD